MQRITVYEWLPAFLGRNLPPYPGYQGDLDPQVSHEAQSAALRFGHTIVPPGVALVNAGECQKEEMAIRVCNSYFDSQRHLYKESGLESVLLGMDRTPAAREDSAIEFDLRQAVFGPLEFSRRDLMAVNIQRSRDHGLPDFNTAKRFFNQAPLDCSAIGTQTKLPFRRLCNAYGNNSDKIDVFPGGLAETEQQTLERLAGQHTKKGPGELFQTIFLKTFGNIRNGDWYWFENDKSEMLTTTEIQDINRTTFAKVLEKVLDSSFSTISFKLTGKARCSVNRDKLESCAPPVYFDHFEGSGAGFIIAFILLGLTAAGMIAGLYFLTKRRKRKNIRATRETGQNRLPCKEFIGRVTGWRRAAVEFQADAKRVVIYNGSQVHRLIDLSRSSLWEVPAMLKIQSDKKGKVFVLVFPNEHDTIMKFRDFPQHYMEQKIEQFLTDCRISYNRQRLAQNVIFGDVTTSEDRHKELELFFQTAAGKGQHLAEDPDYDPAMDINKEVLRCRLTLSEFAEAFNETPNSKFIRNLFYVSGGQKDGLLTFVDFFQVLLTLQHGDPQQKIRLIFAMYDEDGDDYITIAELKTMLKSFGYISLADNDIDELVNHLIANARVERGDKLSFDTFWEIIQSYQQELQQTRLLNTFTDSSQNPPRVSALTQNDTLNNIGYDQQSRNQNGKSNSKGVFSKISNYVVNRRMEIVLSTLYSLVCIGIFLERAYVYGTLSEHGGLRKICGYGVAVTRGAASVIMFTFATLLLTVCRNWITALRETFINDYVPLDKAIEMHKFVAAWAFISTAVHIVGHAFNFYHISTQTRDDLNCYFAEFYTSSNDLPTFNYWLWGTITGFTGVLLTVLFQMVYIFATPYARRHSFKAFWTTHNVGFPLLYFLIFMHGSGRLVQEPIAHLFFLAPIIIFTLDKLVSLSRKQYVIDVMRSEILPSNVVFLEMKRPLGFEYKSGQWVRISCESLGASEYHPFTMTSAPGDETLTLHIRAVGPWTKNLKKLCDPKVEEKQLIPKIHLDGPFGEGQQDWYKYEVSILIGAGIGVTPYASILKDISHRVASRHQITCKKIYFFWVTRTQKQFEWFTEIIRKAEEQIPDDWVVINIYITEFQDQFDLRTMMLYIFERSFQQGSQRSLFTGLRCLTHFSRPNFEQIFREHIWSKHRTAKHIGVFSCGPVALTKTVESACLTMNEYNGPIFVHQHSHF